MKLNVSVFSPGPSVSCGIVIWGFLSLTVRCVMYPLFAEKNLWQVEQFIVSFPLSENRSERAFQEHKFGFPLIKTM